MMKNLSFFLLILLVTTACKELYESPVISPPTGYLVVEGVINSGSGTTNIVLSRTIGLESRNTKFELGALVKVISEDNLNWVLKEKTNGHYSIDNLNLNTNKKYKLSIQTSEGNEYQSDFLAVKNNPAIDNVNWTREKGGVQINVKSHDSEGQTRFYRWDYTETWENFADYKRRLKYQITNVGNNKSYQVVFRDVDDGSGRQFDSTMYYCWKDLRSTQLLIGSSAQLALDEIKAPLTFIPQTSIKLNGLYSINVKQYSLSEEAYEYTEVMKKNSELTGSIFDTQPAILYGNIHNMSNFDEPVIGFMTICPIQELRIFIDSKEVSDWQYLSTCTPIFFDNNNDVIKNEVLPSYTPFSVPTPPDGPFPGISRFLAAPSACVDCTLNGTNIKPNFWPINAKFE